MVNVKNIADEADMIINERYEIDELADAAGGYFAMPSADELAYTELLFDVCDQFGIHYYSADKKARAFVEEVTRVTWAKQQEEKTGVQPVSYTHLDVYKRQQCHHPPQLAGLCAAPASSRAHCGWHRGYRV